MATPPIPSWAVPASGSSPAPAPATTPPPQNSPSEGGIGGFVSNAISGVKNFVSGLLGNKKAPTTEASKAPSWAVAASPDSSTTPAPAASKAPSWAVPQGAAPAPDTQKKTSAPVSDNGTAQTPPTSPFGNLFTQPDTSIADSTTPTPNTESENAEDYTKGLAQSFPRFAAQIGTTVGQAAVNVPYDLYAAAEKVGIKVNPKVMQEAEEEGERGAQAPAPTGLMADIVGTKPVEGVATDVASAEEYLRNSPFAQKTGLSNHALAIAFPAVIGNEAFNILSNFTGGEGELVDQLVKAGTTEEASNILRKTGMDETIVQDIAPYFAQANDKDEVKDMLGVASKMHDALQAGPASEAKQAAKEYTDEAEAPIARASREAQIPNRAPGTLTKEKGEELLARIKTTGGFVTDKEISQIREQFGNISVVVKDVNGQKARMSIDDFDTLYENQAFSDRIRSVYMNGSSVETNVKPDFDESFMEAIQAKKLLENGAPKEGEPFEKIDGVDLKNESSVSASQKSKFVDMAKDERVRSLLKENGIKEVRILAPYHFTLSEQANLLKGKKIININADATDPTGTILHELGHAKFEDLSKEDQDALIQQAKETEDPAMQGYKKIGAWEEIVADSLYKNPSSPSEITKSSSVPENSIQPENALREGIEPPTLGVSSQSSTAELPKPQSIKDIMRAHFEGLMPGKAGTKTFADPKSEQIPTYDVDEPAQAHGLYNVQDGDIKSGPFKGWTKPAKDLFQYDYANTVRSGTRKIAGALARKQLIDMGFSVTDGEADILAFEGFKRDTDGQIVELASGPDRSDKFGKLAKMNDDIYEGDRRAGVQQRGQPIKYRSNYLRIYIKAPDGSIYDGDGNVVAAAEKQGGRRVGKTASFAIPRSFNTNAEAIQAGYTLAFKSVPDLMAARMMEDYKAIADAQLFHGGARLGMVIPDTALSKDPEIRSQFKMYDPERFPKYTTRYRDREGMMKEYVGPYWGPRDFVEKVNNFLFDPSDGNLIDRFFNKGARVSGGLKNAVLSIGVPNLQKLGLGKVVGDRLASSGSGFSLHFWNLLMSTSLFKENPVQFFRYAADPVGAEKWMNENLDKLLTISKDGGTMSAEEHDVESFDVKDLNTMAGVGRQAGNLSKWVHGLFGDSLFGKVMPAMKAQGILARASRYMKDGMSPREAMRRSAEEGNIIWGGMNLDDLGRNKTFQNALRTTLIAPDFAERNIKIGWRAAKSIAKWNDKNLSTYRSFAGFFLMSYAAANLIQYENTGTFMAENDPTHVFSIKSGKDSSGRTRYINIYGTGVDAIRIPAQVASALLEQKWSDVVAVLQNRFSIPVKAAESILTNTDWAGDPIYGTDKYGNPIPAGQEVGNVFNNTIGSAIPSSGQGLISFITGKTSPEQALLQGFALPVGYVKESPNSYTITALEDDAKGDIKNGDYTLYNKLVKAGVIPQRSRAAFIKSALTGAKTTKQTKASAKSKAKLQKEEQLLESEGIDKNTP